jgi:hypothetical protein
LQQSGTIVASGAGIVSGELSIGNQITVLNDFLALVNVFTRFAIVSARFTVMPYSGSTLLGLASFRAPLAIGYYNDGLPIVIPTSYTRVMENE